MSCFTDWSKRRHVTLSIIICSLFHAHLGWHYNVTSGERVSGHVTFTQCKRQTSDLLVSYWLLYIWFQLVILFLKSHQLFTVYCWFSCVGTTVCFFAQCIYGWRLLLCSFKIILPFNFLVIQDSCSWPYGKTYDTQLFVGCTRVWHFQSRVVIFPCLTHCPALSVMCV